MTAGKAGYRAAGTIATTSEIKFLVTPAVALRIREWARAYFEPDLHGAGRYSDEYDISTLYFDTRQLDVFHRRGSYGRAKYRVRRYGNADVVFLERKLRRPGILIKRRTAGPVDALHLFEASHSVQGWFGEWFHRRILARQLRPLCEISYRRVARTLNSPGSIVRLTLDTALRVKATDQTRFSQAPGVPFLESHYVLELKYQMPLPAVCRRLVEEFALDTQRASKYRLGMAALRTGSADAPVPMVIDTALAHA
jgi:hypothetical protein